MKTLADFKRALTLGSKWKYTYFQWDGENAIPYLQTQCVREVGKVQSNAVAFLTDKRTLSYLHFPKSSEFQINDRGEAEIYFPADVLYNLPRRLVLTYSKVEA